jgi:hypothetical protein
MDGKGWEGKAREGKGRGGKGRQGKGREGMGMELSCGIWFFCHSTEGLGPNFQAEHCVFKSQRTNQLFVEFLTVFNIFF